MTQNLEKYREIAAEVLARCKQIHARFPNPNPQTANGWGYAFARSGLPPWIALWVEAVGDYWTHATGGDSPTPGDIIRAAKRVRDRQEADPTTRGKWREFREQRTQHLDHQIKTGTHRLQIEATTRNKRLELENPRNPMPDHVRTKLNELTTKKGANSWLT
ncbi:hypothetical protein [Corynebacterium renale]|uniref:hypothetical protein n=1 Tax=Corynebacterium renale TaxID=1724 RepID=UPI000E02A889|nr:hypothetical protein [Corynebacterium renale]STC97661.1 Uncharacterised protein [Corynebacterium renale]STD70281.1 Uncharacterised protein [Corynebacterium renale]